MVGGNLGLALCCLSMSGIVKMTFTADEDIMDDQTARMFLKSVEDLIMTEMNKFTD